MPQCPEHHREMKPSKKGGGFFCTAKLADETYCKYTITGGPTKQFPNESAKSGDADLVAAIKELTAVLRDLANR